MNMIKSQKMMVLHTRYIVHFGDMVSKYIWKVFQQKIKFEKTSKKVKYFKSNFKIRTDITKI